MDHWTCGAIAGATGTAVMSATMAVAHAFDMTAGEVPPRKIARNLDKALGVDDELPEPVFEANWIAQHFAYGTAAGIVYALIRKRLRIAEPVPSGPLFGGVLCALGYAGWLPAVGLYPPPHAQPKRRIGMLILSHIVYGTVTAATAQALCPSAPNAWMANGKSR
jgi:hypothetical protein